MLARHSQGSTVEGYHQVVHDVAVMAAVGQAHTETWPKSCKVSDQAIEAIYDHFLGTDLVQHDTAKGNCVATHRVLFNPELLEMVLAAIPLSKTRIFPGALDHFEGVPRCSANCVRFDHGVQMLQYRRVNGFFRDLIDTSPLLG